MSNLEQLDKNSREYAEAKTLAEAERLDVEWNAIWSRMTAAEKRTYADRLVDA